MQASTLLSLIYLGSDEEDGVEVGVFNEVRTDGARLRKIPKGEALRMKVKPNLTLKIDIEVEGEGDD